MLLFGQIIIIKKLIHNGLTWWEKGPTATVIQKWVEDSPHLVLCPLQYDEEE